MALKISHGVDIVRKKQFPVVVQREGSVKLNLENIQN